MASKEKVIDEEVKAFLRRVGQYQEHDGGLTSNIRSPSCFCDNIILLTAVKICIGMESEKRTLTWDARPLGCQIIMKMSTVGQDVHIVWMKCKTHAMEEQFTSARLMPCVSAILTLSGSLCIERLRYNNPNLLWLVSSVVVLEFLSRRKQFL